jgi:hypothetical protein
MFQDFCAKDVIELIILKREFVSVSDYIYALVRPHIQADPIRKETGIAGIFATDIQSAPFRTIFCDENFYSLASDLLCNHAVTIMKERGKHNTICVPGAC